MTTPASAQQQAATAAAVSQAEQVAHVAREVVDAPRVTPAQRIAVLVAAVGIAAAIAAPVAPHWSSQVVDLCKLLALALVGGDAVAQHGRATGIAKTIAQAAAPPPSTPGPAVPYGRRATDRPTAAPPVSRPEP